MSDTKRSKNYQINLKFKYSINGYRNKTENPKQFVYET